MLFRLLPWFTLLRPYHVAYQRYICKSWGTPVSDHRVHVEGQYYLSPLDRMLEPRGEVAGLRGSCRQVDPDTVFFLVFSYSHAREFSTLHSMA